MKRALIITIAMAFACYANAAFNCPVYRQGDPRWGNNELGFGSSTIAQMGCFLTCQTAMIASQGIKVNGQTPDPGNMNSWFKANGEFQGGDVLYKAPEKFGFTYDGKMTSKSDILNAFNEGKFVFLHVKNFSHWVVVTDYDSNGYKIMDPAGVKTSYAFSEVPEVCVYTAPAGSPGTSSSSSSTPSSSSPSSPSQSTTPTTPTATPTQPAQTTPSSPQQQDNSQQDSSLVSESLTAHNEWRAAVGVPDLAWDATLAASAQAWADHIASTGSVSHSSNRNNIGENIAYGTTSTNTVTDFVDLWGAESKYFVAGKPYPQCTRGSEADVWHYTQLVWKATTQVGCGMGQSNGKSYYVCQYYPRGNMRGQSVF